MKKYDLVISDNLKELIDTVNEAIKLNYIPIGGVIYDGQKFIQAILFKN